MTNSVEVEKKERRSVLQDWVQELTFMQQSVLITACRGPDTLPKDHVAKLILRWLRRCFLISAFDGRALTNPYEKGGGSFTGPLPESHTFESVCKAYLKVTDETPHHFHLHLLHASEILGYKHPDPKIRNEWRCFYLLSVRDMHLNPESEEEMDRRLGDNREDWLAAESVTASGQMEGVVP